MFPFQKKDTDKKFDTPKDMASDKKKGIKEDSSEDRALDKKAFSKKPSMFPPKSFGGGRSF